MSRESPTSSRARRWCRSSCVCCSPCAPSIVCSPTPPYFVGPYLIAFAIDLLYPIFPMNFPWKAFCIVSHCFLLKVVIPRGKPMLGQNICSCAIIASCRESGAFHISLAMSFACCSRCACSSFWLQSGASHTPSVRSPCVGSSLVMTTWRRSSSVCMMSSPGASSIVSMCSLPLFHRNLIRNQ
jgi:hypothetical protein